MAFDEALAGRLRRWLSRKRGVDERRMFGGLAFLSHGRMFCGVVGDRLMARVGPDRYDEALRRPHASVMDFTGQPMKGFLFVEPAGIRTDESLGSWVEPALSFVETLPRKKGSR